jgi:hypothetical protein
MLDFWQNRHFQKAEVVLRPVRCHKQILKIVLSSILEAHLGRLSTRQESKIYHSTVERWL